MCTRHNVVAVGGWALSAQWLHTGDRCQHVGDVRRRLPDRRLVEHTPWAIKKRATLFSTITLAFLERLLCFLYQWNRNECSKVCLLYDVNCFIASHEIATTRIDCFLKCVRPNRLFVFETLAESGPVLVIFNSYWDFLSVFWLKSFTLPQVFFYGNFIFERSLFNSK